MKQVAERPWALVLLFPAGLGVIILMDILPGAARYVPLGVLAFALAVRFADARGWAARFPSFVSALVHVLAVGARWLGAVIVPLMALLGIDWVVAKLGYRPNPLLGMVIAAPILGFAAWIYLQPWWSVPASRRPKWWAIRVTAFLVAATTLAGLWQYLKREDPPADGKAVSQLELVVVGTGPSVPRIAPPAGETGWTIRTWAGRADGRTVAWGESGPPPATPEHDRILLLDVDGTDRAAPASGIDPDEPARWAAIAADAGRTDATTFALLRRDAPGRVEAWQDRFKLTSAKRPGDVVLLKGANATRPLADLALHLVARAPTADEDLVLAAQHRPILRFHKGRKKSQSEKTSTPLNVDRLIEAELFRLCSTRQVFVRNCTNVDDSSDITNGSNFLEFNTKTLAQHTEDATIYVRVSDHEGRKYLDYWWYLPDNPSNAGGGALCGAGFVVAGLTCHDHQSDWEGVTVVVDPNSESRSPEAVHYSAHKHRRRYTWPTLERIWRTGVTATVVRGETSALRPIVFIARGTHAAYPNACRGNCQTHFPAQKEEPYDGGLRWPGAREAECVALCLTALPTIDRGSKPARWNAYNGLWGAPRCELLVFCSEGDPPRSPGQQRRYMKPWCPTVALKPAPDGRGFDIDRAYRRPPDCG